MKKQIKQVELPKDDSAELAIDNQFLDEFRKLSGRYKRDFTLATRFTPQGALTTIILKRLV